jgi:hypothetical protein
MPARITDEIHAQVIHSLIQCFQQQFGDQWRVNIHKNVRALPFVAIAAEHGLSVYQVKKIYARFKMLGYIMRDLGDGPAIPIQDLREENATLT